MRPRVSVRFEIALAVCVVLIAAIIAWQVVAGSKRPLDSVDMKIDAGDLVSYAAEGGLLAKQRVGASITRSYSIAQSAMWRDKIEQIVRKYESREPAADLTQPFDDMRALAQRLLSVADAAMDDYSKEGTSSATASELDRVRSDARELRSRLAAKS